MHILDPLQGDYSHLSQIYEKIFEKNAVAFLGAGASVTNKQYLSNELIKYYEAKINKNFGTNDIIKFVDILQTTPGLNRSDFDKFVLEQLSKLRPNQGHDTFVTIPWKLIITTNYDTLVEEASDNAVRENKTHYSLHVIKNKKQLDSQNGNNALTYIKLNGCKSDISLYPLVFSSEDFESQASYHKKVASPFRQFTNDIVFIAFGYSFMDEFAEKLLDKIANNDIRQKRILYCVDPFINSDRLSYLASKQICVIKMSFEEFFEGYQKWFEDTNRSYLKGLQKFTNPDNSNIKLPPNSRLFLDGNIVQLKEDYKSNNRLKKADFYFGEEPTYQVVIENFDVIKEIELSKVLLDIRSSFETDNRTSIPTFVLVNGDFGTGKTTFTLRAIREYLKESENTLAFEITNPLKIKRGYLSQLIKESSATHFIFYCDNIETDSIFKSFNSLRVDLATDQHGEVKIIFISSIRENILERFKNNNRNEVKNCKEIDYVSIYSQNELVSLVENLKEVGILKFRDLRERDAIIYDVKSKYKGDSFMTLYKLIENGEHYKLLEKAYNELSADVKNAFKITALIHRFGMLCPAFIIKDSIKTYDWNDFTEKIVKGDGKKILFQENKFVVGDEPNLYFKTKHPVIAEALIKTILKNNEKNSLYKDIFNTIKLSDYGARFIVDLIKNIRNNDEDITSGQVDNYFSLAKKEFQTSSHFMLSYITNIEKQTSVILTLENCLNEITFLESTLERRNHRLIHRKGCICQKIAKILFKADKNDDKIKEYTNDSKEWFEIKKLLDPSSHYSYVEYLNLLIWELKNIKQNDDEKLQTLLRINNLFDEAYKTLYNNTGIIDDIYGEYINYIDVEVDGNFLEFLLERYKDVNTRITACILLFYYYDRLEEDEKAMEFFEELKNYKDNHDAVYFLFKQCGRNLHIANNRVEFFELTRNNNFLEKKYPLRYYYFSSICEFYNWKWRDGRDYLQELKQEKIFVMNPDFFLYWRTPEGYEEIFEGVVIKDFKNKKVKINLFYKEFIFVPGNYEKLKENQIIQVKLKFFLDGMRAELFEE